jgi:hypothetical protein
MSDSSPEELSIGQRHTEEKKCLSQIRHPSSKTDVEFLGQRRLAPICCPAIEVAVEKVLSDRDTSTAREGKDHEHGYFPVLSHIVVFKRLDSYLSLRDGTNELCGQKAGRVGTSYMRGQTSYYFLGEACNNQCCCSVISPVSLSGF